MTKFKLSENIVCIAQFKPKTGKRDELIQALSELIPLSKGEPGCLRYELHQSVENPEIITFIDRFKDQSAFDFHCETEYIKKHFDEILPGLTDSIEITLHREITF